MTRDEFIQANPIEDVLSFKSVKLIGSGNERKCVCPFHEDKNPSMSVNVDKQAWHCHACDIGGGVIDLLAKFANMSPVEYIKANGIGSENHRFDSNSITPSAPRHQPQPTPVQAKQPTVKTVIEKVYDYIDLFGNLAYQVVRLKPKSFRQRHSDGNGGWIWNMSDVTRILYRLPEVSKSQTVWICEGEKDADTLVSMGYCATTNVGGAGKWMDGYTEALTDKDIVLCGDNDKAGKEHIESVFEALAGKVKTARIVNVPSGYKDITAFVESVGIDSASNQLKSILDASQAFYRGFKLPLYSLSEIEQRYKKYVKTLDQCTLDLSKWLPAFYSRIRGVVPGELVLLLGDTGAGKTALLQSLAYSCRPLPTLFLEMELPETLIYERFLAMAMNASCNLIEEQYKTNDDSFGESMLDKKLFQNLLICTEARMTLETIENLIVKSELKLGCKPVVVFLDYVQLINGKGSRYERTTDAAEGLKVIAKKTNTIIVVSSQVGRPANAESNEVTLHSGKDSGGLENSAGLVLGAWRDKEDAMLMTLKVLKSTKGGAGLTIECDFDGARMRISQRSPIPVDA